MKKLLLLPLLLAAMNLFAEDAVLVENFSKVGNVSTNNYTWEGDICTWDAFMTARRVQDTIHTANQKQAIWLSLSNAGAAKVSTKDFEGGIKTVAFKYARYGSENKDGRVLQLKVTVGETENSTPTYAKNAMKVGNGASADHETYSYEFKNKKAGAQLSIENISTATESLTASGICRICVGDITVTPYLRYTAKEATLDLRLGSNKFTNEGLINNIDEGAIVYSISDNTIGATIDATTGEVTATNGGEVTVTATWGEIVTSYKLTILAKGVATASFAKESILAKINETSPTNAFETNSTASATYSSSEESVAKVNAGTGALTLVGVGTTVITANVSENEDYLAASASYTLRVVPANFMIETFESAAETSSTYANPAESTTGDICKWTAQLGGIKHMTDNNYIPMFGTSKYAVFRAPRQNEDKVPYIESDEIEGGIEYLTFQANPTAGEGTTNWDIRVFINGVQVGENLTDFASSPQNEFKTITIPNIKVGEPFVIRFENHSTINGTYTSGNKGRLAIDNIEWCSYEAPAPEHIYSVAGAEALMGVKWKADDTNAEMALQNDGTYKLVRENVELAKGTYDYKVVIDHKWDNGEAQTNSTLNIDKSGIYDVTFTYDPSKPETGATAVLKQEIVVLPAVALAGGFNNWGQESFTPADDQLTASITKNLALGNWKFKIVVSGAWLGEGQTITRENNSTTVSVDGQDMTLDADHSGDYTFTWTYETNTLTVTYPADDTPEEHIYSLAGSPALFGVNWDPTGDFNMVKQNDGKYTYQLADIELAKGSYEYKVVIDHRWNNGEAADNSVLTIDKAGIYDVTFTYDPSKPETGAVANLKQELVILPEVDLAGAFNNWVQNDAFTPAEDKLTATITKELTAGEYNFKVIVATSWRGAEQVFTRANNSYVIDSNGLDMTLVADCDGTYLFTWTYATDQLAITFPVGTGINAANAARSISKQIIDGQLVITVNGVSYNAQGELIR